MKSFYFLENYFLGVGGGTLFGLGGALFTFGGTLIGWRVTLFSSAISLLTRPGVVYFR
ncbi:hypothetical protein [Sporosarcina sp. YIM B06819]|uniref:hypothetical protein n=1 Tax=Sporosarcina sp. YIM B06819 TaxID=3081769 RepID=UPI00298CD0DA|nr:hypothetical protein [Sporosarcina sp. YIM B06819]